MKLKCSCCGREFTAWSMRPDCYECYMQEWKSNLNLMADDDIKDIDVLKTLIGTKQGWY